MRSILTASGAVIHVDTNSSFQSTMLPIALSAFGGEVAQIEIEEPA